RVGPVVEWAGVDLFLGADEGAAFDAGDIARVGGGVIGVGTLGRVEAFERTEGDQFGGDGVELGVRAVAPVHAVGLGERGDLADPGDQFRVLGRRRVQAGDGGVSSSFLGFHQSFA